MVGTHNVISISSDGKLCSWSLDMLSMPQDTLELQQRQSKPIAITFMFFSSNEINNLAMAMFILLIDMEYVRVCLKSMRSILRPVTGISTHLNQSTPDFGDLFLTSSIDWTIKLWNLKNQATRSLSLLHPTTAPWPCINKNIFQSSRRLFKIRWRFMSINPSTSALLHYV
ncbi:cytoplasmic dynein 1 intermediate chain-like isoform X1 [Episyrphus balteatus]|uniref:cytoplasmic dynein 1 intermediate chain-like isoform X1 n=1 Tax=Episyrphus balteatus TaxID=286459 RepID=UPI0024867528|nr:cytoplasmic dynein 1 intermediate chain-like isoform X1 [Episyrphus balteatus]XP_055843207.1 cytoplasmic dynein 1 intermediate chain-like isoform X1 [Episyrphus balteatus]